MADMRYDTTKIFCSDKSASLCGWSQKISENSLFQSFQGGARSGREGLILTDNRWLSSTSLVALKFYITHCQDDSDHHDDDHDNHDDHSNHSDDNDNVLPDTKICTMNFVVVQIVNLENTFQAGGVDQNWIIECDLPPSEQFLSSVLFSGPLNGVTHHLDLALKSYL